MITFWHVLELFQYRAWNSYETMVLYYLVLTVCVAFVMAMSDLRNVALNKPASQSSEEEEINQHAGRAVDGDSNANYGYPEVSCSSTYTWDTLITHAWWMVNLEKDYRIESITIQNREDCCGDRLRNLTIKFARSNGDFLERASFLGPATNGSYHVFEIDNFIGRYVKLTSWESYAILTLCEVQVWARDISKDATFVILDGKKSNAGVLGELVTSSVQTCAYRCHTLPDCVAVNYWDAPSATANCQLMDGVEPQETASGYKLIKAQ